MPSPFFSFLYFRLFFFHPRAVLEVVVLLLFVYWVKRRYNLRCPGSAKKLTKEEDYQRGSVEGIGKSDYRCRGSKASSLAAGGNSSKENGVWWLERLKRKPRPVLGDETIKEKSNCKTTFYFFFFLRLFGSLK